MKVKINPRFRNRVLRFQGVEVGPNPVEVSASVGRDLLAYEVDGHPLVVKVDEGFTPAEPEEEPIDEEASE